MESVNNDLVQGATGRIGNMLVFRQRGGKTFIAKRPRKKEVPDSEGQELVKEKFRMAVAYAKAVCNDPARKEVYQAKASRYTSAYNLAVSDFCKAPEIKSIYTEAYSGKTGDEISMRVMDDFQVESVTVQLKDEAGALIEQGPAALSESMNDWVYIAKTDNPGYATGTITVIAKDIPGNTTVKEV
ncbi:hypothetical protein [Pedobacter sp. SYSU D00535]|uniref:hypothetical protein n=1 Tax=Pedobacter sp. SYSU D00535 TaxID=2810308 RepID=UPI001A964B69|nr:hypothetical protein [Pedobacter sp. SYSU D00535]